MKNGILLYCPNVMLSKTVEFQAFEPKYMMALVVKYLPANEGDLRNAGSISGLERSPGVGNGTHLQYSYLENSMGREA